MFLMSFAEEIEMPTYIMLATWTEQGISNIKESPTRFDAFKQSLEQTGGQVKGFYLVTGQYDMVCIVEAPSDEVITKLGLASAAKGAIRTQIMRAFTEDEYRKLIAALP
jgi:uncharacterized protein with GYD domain